MVTSRACEHCGKTFIVGRYKKKRFCSRSCWLTRYNAQDREHTMKGAFAGGAANQLKRGSGTGRYVKRNGRHEHRVVAEQMLGRPLRTDEVVHHKDGDGRNNSPDNLEVMTQNEHAKLHSDEMLDARKEKRGW